MNETDDGVAPRHSIEVTEGAMEALEKTRGWIKFLGVLSVIAACMAGLLLLAGLAVLAARSVVGLPVVAEGVIGAAIMILYAIYWLRYSGALKRLSEEARPSDDALEEVFVRQRRLWTFQGALFIVVIVLAALAVALLPHFLHHPPLHVPIR